MRRWNLLWTLLIATALPAVGCIGESEPTLKCTSNDDCLDSGSDGISYVCDDTLGICLRSCTEATEAQDCLASQFCEVATGATDGVCRDGNPSSGGDPGPGDPGPGDPGPGDPASGD